ncbi:NAD(P)/FAD-dependent oxidoreductase [Variovorax sp. RA8]|uniref:NAD(P)/FAD-dependent oxidoreductase n=1 Tax=Variovorax sp. (strain JCM 16519 / RA8) TaxID=662548 RepID=UPI0013188E2C|nr:FAD-dependent oxidoreductase [Variovorax sp. RA8]VTU17715.1 Anthranilate 1,2-dioxygenase system ferredoxin--NAD(+) reductase component [Variovorax sp. RA8]
MSHEDPILIVGAGQAGATAAAALRAFGHAGRIVMVGSEQPLPYERPPLSKAVLCDAAMDERIGIHPAGFHADHSIELRLGTVVASIDAARSVAHCSDGEALSFSRCLLATGGRARGLPDLPEGTPGVHTIRTLADAQALRGAMRQGKSLVVLGAGFLGLEIASTARAMGLEVAVLESAPHVLARAVPVAFSQWLEQRVRRTGIDLRLACRCTSIRPCPDGVEIALDDGSALHAALLVVAIGLVPEVELARASGLELNPVNGGIRIDAQCRTSAAHIFAAGDCTSQFQPLLGEEIRLESWQSANEQARIAAGGMLGVATEPAATPWFWTDQFGCNVQMLGMPVPGLTYQLRGSQAPDDATPKFLLLGFDSEARLCHAIAVNAGGDLRQLRALVERRTPCRAAALCDASIPMRQAVRDTVAATYSLP